LVCGGGPDPDEVWDQSFHRGPESLCQKEREKPANKPCPIKQRGGAIRSRGENRHDSRFVAFQGNLRRVIRLGGSLQKKKNWGSEPEEKLIIEENPARAVYFKRGEVRGGIRKEKNESLKTNRKHWGEGFFEGHEGEKKTQAPGGAPVISLWGMAEGGLKKKVA